MRAARHPLGCTFNCVVEICREEGGRAHLLRDAQNKFISGARLRIAEPSDSIGNRAASAMRTSAMSVLNSIFDKRSFRCSRSEGGRRETHAPKADPEAHRLIRRNTLPLWGDPTVDMPAPKRNTQGLHFGDTRYHTRQRADIACRRRNLPLDPAQLLSSGVQLM